MTTQRSGFAKEETRDLTASGLRIRSINALSLSAKIASKREVESEYTAKAEKILYDKTGNRYKKGMGLRVYANENEIGSSQTLQKLVTTLVQ